MVIYMPIYLHNTIGFDWSSIGAIFTVMLIPFVIFEAPLGRLFDSNHSEKEALIAGFIILGFTTFLMFFINSAHISTWMLVLFFSRVGASFIEIGSEYSFFKRISDQDAGLISIFKMSGPTAYIIVPLLVQPFISMLPLSYVFLLTGIGLFSGIIFAYKIRTIRAV